MRIGDSEKGLKITAYIFSFIFTLLIIFPILYLVSLSLMDDNVVNSYPPKVIPPSPDSISIIIDYSKYMDKTEAELKDMILRDSAVAMYSTAFEQRGSIIGEIKVLGTMNGKTVYNSRAHIMALKSELQFGVYKKILVRTDLLLDKGRYLKSADIMGYTFNKNGIDKNFNNSDLGKDNLSNEIGNNLKEKYTISGEYIGSIVHKNFLLLFENYKYYYLMPTYIYKDVPVIKKFSFFAFMFNTLITVVFAAFAQLILTSLSAYPLSRLLSKKVANRVMLFFLFTMMVPFVCIMIPQLLLMKGWGFYNTYKGMLFPWLYPAPFSIFLFKGFFDRIPTPFFDAAKMDGANEMYIFTRICLPMSKSIITIIAVGAFIAGWSDFFWYFLVSNKMELWTLNVANYVIGASPGAMNKQNFVMGLATVSIVPILIVAAIFSKQIKNSVISSGIKG